jgi:hypothetical protein
MWVRGAELSRPSITRNTTRFCARGVQKPIRAGQGLDPISLSHGFLPEIARRDTAPCLDGDEAQSAGEHGSPYEAGTACF